MAIAGYSGTPLLKKLGIKPEMKIRLINPPGNYHDLLGADIRKQLVKTGNADFAHVFAISRQELQKQFAELIQQLPATAMIWISWYKKSANMPTDITENVIREIVLPTGWVDVKVCAVSDLWSGLKIVKRLAER
ncbi:MAG: DUF3052 domain-containing protein [Bacteroidota bacterium]